MQTTKELMAAYEEKANTCGLVVQCPGDGMFSSTIAIVSDYPGAREVAARSPFVGGAGTKLWNTLRKFGFNRNDFYITNVCKRIVASDDDENIGAGMPQKLSRGERELWQDLIKWELAKLPNLRYILCLGGLALEALTGHDGITSWRGSVLDISLQDFEDRQDLSWLLCFVRSTLQASLELRKTNSYLIWTWGVYDESSRVDGNHIWLPYPQILMLEKRFGISRTCELLVDQLHMTLKPWEEKLPVWVSLAIHMRQCASTSAQQQSIGSP
jgi:uracil-DNA glycosylase family 4